MLLIPPISARIRARQEAADETETWAAPCSDQPHQPALQAVPDPVADHIENSTETARAA
ncbi:hypothetical protein ACFC58_06715 [Kitasatospora purpeofusca]|uniref:hypothetical protein n=1 Tax=Kitasatospora purpeofusca TaxID=67352 RepID=UPI0035DB45CE